MFPSQSVAWSFVCSPRAVATKKRLSLQVRRVGSKRAFPRTSCTTTSLPFRPAVDRSIPPPQESIRETNVKEIHNIYDEEQMPTHGGYHYSSTAVEWLKLIYAIQTCRKSGDWIPEVPLDDGLRAVEMGMMATSSIVNDRMRNAEGDDHKRAQSCPAHN